MARRRKRGKRKRRRLNPFGKKATPRSLMAVAPLVIWATGLLTGAVRVETPTGRAFVTGFCILVGISLILVRWPVWLEATLFGLAFMIALGSLTAIGGGSFFPYAVAILFFGILGAGWLARFRDREVKERDAWKKSVTRTSR